MFTRRVRSDNALVMGEMDVIRQIDVFDKEREWLVEEIVLTSFDLLVMQKRFEVKPNDPLMYDPYEITSATADLFP
ncbi:hypothetical protein E1176_00035, partial [Fulvivirga sp. RKSG066]|uniref:DUF7683 domain-containing protein n=1 Tax=Fulvivirga aurantia TaxID=2529383 RepID=UPI0012BB94E6